MQHDRRTNPYPWTWEPVAAVLFAYSFVAFLTLHVSRSVANLVSGGGWHATGQGRWLRATVDIVRGNASAGLVPAPDCVAAEPVLYGCLGLGQALLLAASAWVGVWALRRFGPGRLRGAASASEVEAVLGMRRLRRSAGIIRPDLYGVTKS